MEGFHKYPKIYTIGHSENEEIFAFQDDEIVIEEKIDGGNFRFMVHDGKIIIGSRTQQLTDDEGEDTNMNKQFKRCSDYVRAKIEPNIDNALEGCIYYGENCVKHTMGYDWDKMPPFLGFDIYNIDEGFFLFNKEILFGRLGLLHVPTIKICTKSDIVEINDDLVPISKYASPSNKDQKAEGIVFKNYSKQIFAKYVRDVFKERNAETFGGSPKYNRVDDTHNADFVFKYCTNPRIDKAIFKLIDEGHALDMAMMTHLPRNIYYDIWSEHWGEIRDSNWKLDLPKIRKLIPKRCAAVLKQVIVNNALENKE